MTEQLGATNIEVGDSFPITYELLAPHALVVFAQSDAGSIPTHDEVQAISQFVSNGGHVFVMAGALHGGPYANAITSPFGISVADTTSPDTDWVRDFVTDPLTDRVTELFICGPGFLTVQPPATMLGSYYGYGMLAKSPYGQGQVAAWGDDWVFYNCVLGEGSNAQFAENLCLWAGVPEPGTLSLLLLSGLVALRRR